MQNDIENALTFESSDEKLLHAIRFPLNFVIKRDADNIVYFQYNLKSKEKIYKVFYILIALISNEIYFSTF